MAEPQISVEVVFARPGEQALEQFRVAADATVEDVIRQSGFLERFPEIDMAQAKVGVFGKLTKLDATLNEGDRIEIYRPLIADPKEVRRRLAKEGKVMGRKNEDGD